MVTKHQGSPQTLAAYLSGIVLEPNAAAVQVYGMVQQLRGRMALTPFFGLAIYRAHPDRVDELLTMVGQYRALLLALQALCQGQKPGEIEFLSLPQVVPGKSESHPPVSAAKPKAKFPGSGSGLSADQAALPLATVLEDGSRLSHMIIPLLAKNRLTTLGQLVERWCHNGQFRDRRLLTITGIGLESLTRVIRPCVAKALGIPEAALSSSAAKGNKKTAKRGSKAQGAVTKLVNMGEPWLAFGLTQDQWSTPLKKLITEDSLAAHKLRRLIGRRKLTVGEVLGPTKGKMARIRKQFFPKNFGPETQKYLKAKLAALRVPQEMLVMTMAPLAPVVEEEKH